MAKVYCVLAVLAMSAAASAQNGLLGEYYNFGTGGAPQPPPGSPAGGSFAATPNHRRIDAQVNFAFTMNPGPAPGVNADHFIVAWSGFLTSNETGNHIFGSTSDDGIRFWVNNVLVRDDWADQGESGTVEAGGTVMLTAGVAVPIRVEMYENAGGEAAKIHWALPSAPATFVVIPTTALTPPAGPAAPPAPTAVAGFDAAGGPIVDVAWTGSGAGITFDLQRSVNGGAFANVLTGTTATSYTDTQVTTGQPHCYRVRRIQDGLLVGPYSQAGCATPQPPPPRTAGDNSEGLLDENCACGAGIPSTSAGLASLLALALWGRRRRR